MTSTFERITLRNGHRAIRHTGHGEVMHPSVGPWAEANALYVEPSRLAQRLAEGSSKDAPLYLYDIGLGAGANASAAVIAARRVPGARRALHVVSYEHDLEALRLALEDPQGFDFLAPVREPLQALLSCGEWSEPGLRWRLIEGDLRDTLERADRPADIVFHDPFSPASNPDLWSPAFFSRLRARCADQGATLFTYSAATPTRVSLLLANFWVGYGRPIGLKSQTTVASTTLGDLEKPLGREWLQRWERSSARAAPGVPLTAELEAAVRNHRQFQEGVSAL